MVTMIGVFNGFSVGVERRKFSTIWGGTEEEPAINYFTGFTVTIACFRFSVGRLFEIEYT